MRRSAAALAAALAGACASRGDAPRDTAVGALAPGVSAQVGDDSISTITVARIATARGLAPARARALAIEDALFAAGARAVLAPERSHVAERASLARAMLEHYDRAARAAGPPSDAEVEELSRARFWELDRPPAVRTSHAVALLGPGQDAEAARALAERVARAVASSTDPTAFEQAARSVEPDRARLVVEALPPVTADGRTVPDKGLGPGASQTFDGRFAVAANALPRVGAMSPVVETSFGFHVIYAREIVPTLRIPLEERRRLLADEILAGRARRALETELARLRSARPITIEASFDELTAPAGDP